MAGHDEAIADCAAYARQQDTEGLRDERVLADMPRGLSRGSRGSCTQGLPIVQELDSAAAELLIRQAECVGRYPDGQDAVH